MVEGSVSDPFDGCNVDKGAVALVVAMAAGERAEEGLHFGFCWFGFGLVNVANGDSAEGK